MSAARGKRDSTRMYRVQQVVELKPDSWDGQLLDLLGKYSAVVLVFGCDVTESFKDSGRVQKKETQEEREAVRAALRSIPLNDEARFISNDVAIAFVGAECETLNEMFGRPKGPAFAVLSHRTTVPAAAFNVVPDICEAVEAVLERD